MDNLQPLILYWGLTWAVVGSAVTPLVFDRRGRNPWWGGLIGLIVGIASGEVFGWTLLQIFESAWPAYARWLSIFGGLVLLLPLWIMLKPRPGEQLRTHGIVPGTIVPLIFYLISLSALPMIWAIALAFFEYDPAQKGGPILGLGGENKYVGTQYFEEMVEGDSRNPREFRNSVETTIKFTAVVVPLNLLLTIPLASMIESVHQRVRVVFRSIYFLPVVTSSVGVAIMWGYIFNAQYGLANEVTGMAGIKPVAWLQDPRLTIWGIPIALFAVIIAYLWQDFGYNTVIFIAALQGIPDHLKEAARVDGATPLQVFWHITLPLLRPTILFASVFTLISSFQVFDIIQVMTQGGPGRVEGKTKVMVLNIYENAFRFGRMGWAAAMSLVLVAMMLLFTLFQLWAFRSDWEY